MQSPSLFEWRSRGWEGFMGAGGADGGTKESVVVVLVLVVGSLLKISFNIKTGLAGIESTENKAPENAATFLRHFEISVHREPLTQHSSRITNSHSMIYINFYKPSSTSGNLASHSINSLTPSLTFPTASSSNPSSGALGTPPYPK